MNANGQMRLELTRAIHATEPQALWDARRNFWAHALIAGWSPEQIQAAWDAAWEAAWA